MSYMESPVIGGAYNTPANIIDRFCSIRNTSLEDLKKVSRKQEIVYNRHLVMYLLKNKTKLNLREIGELFGKDHATVIHSCNKIAGYISINDYLGLTALELMKKV